MASFFLDKKSPIEKNNNGDLPHWFQPEKIQYVTFRLSDSLPVVKIDELNEIRKRFMAVHPQPWDEKTMKKYNMVTGNHQEDILDRGYGESHLKHKEYRKIVSDSLHFGDDKTYQLIAFVIMPNHVHLLIQPFGGERVETIIGSIKRFTARAINEKLGRTGILWQREVWSRIVRNPSGLTRYIEYIKQNPRNLKEDEYELYIRKDFM
ncbi:MAG: transposase [Muribaculaceae bacterium]|nr:transposase [Muribaculaceae bacterium]